MPDARVLSAPRRDGPLFAAAVWEPTQAECPASENGGHDTRHTRRKLLLLSCSTVTSAMRYKRGGARPLECEVVDSSFGANIRRCPARQQWKQRPVGNLLILANG